VELIEVDQRQLVMTQNQLDSKKVGVIYTAIMDGGWWMESVLIASREGAILDGHHRWAAAAAARAAGLVFSPRVLQVGMGSMSCWQLRRRSRGRRSRWSSRSRNRGTK
jgi:hypothetical protein